MKKIISLFTVFTVFKLVLLGQSAISGAEQLSFFLTDLPHDKTVAQFDPAQDSAFLAIAVKTLIQFTDNPSDIKDAADLNDAYDGNPFIGGDNGFSKILLPNTFQASAILSDIGPKPSKAPASGSATGGGRSIVTNLADGLAKFLVKRTKEELTITFFQKFKDKLTSNVYLQGIFPQTAALLGLIDNEIYQINAYIQTLREHFVKDLKALPINLKSFLRTNDLLLPTEQIIADDMLELAQMILDEDAPIKLIQYMGEHSALHHVDSYDNLLPNQRKEFTDAAMGFSLLQLLSESLLSYNSNSEWVNPNFLQDLLDDKQTFYLYLGLLWQKGDGIKFSNGTSLRGVLNDIADVTKGLQDVKKQLITFTDYADDVKVSLQSIKAKKSKNEAVYDDYYLFFHSSFSLLESGIRFEKKLFSRGDSSTVLENKILSLLRHFNELNFDVRQKNYTSAVTDLIFIFDELIAKDSFTFKSDLLKYGNFIALVAEAEESDQVAAAIEAVALPVGSSITKKYASFSVALNAYTGVAYGVEELQINGKKNFFGVAAPLGLSFSKGFNKKGSLSLFTSIIDVGALAAIRFDDNNTSQIPELTFKNIVAPGGYLVYGFGRDMPIAFGVGAQLGPNLRAIEGTATIDEFDNGWRWGVFLGVDIPVFNLYVR